MKRRIGIVLWLFVAVCGRTNDLDDLFREIENLSEEETEFIAPRPSVPVPHFNFSDRAGQAGFDAAMAYFFPQTERETGGRLTANEIEGWIADLHHRKFKVREAAMNHLREKGARFKNVIELHAKSADPEVSMRIREVLKTWSGQENQAANIDYRAQAERYRNYIDGLKDDTLLLELAKRTGDAVRIGISNKDQQKLIGVNVGRLVKTANDQYLEPLRPILEAEDEETVKSTIRTLGSYSGNGYFPELLLDALKSGRPAIVEEALSWTPNCWDNAKRDRVRERVTKIFEGDNDVLKFKSSFSMMHSYGDPRAIAYLLKQLDHDDPRRVTRALGWIGDARNANKQATPEILDALTPLLKNDDDKKRRAAADALGTYQGQAVIDRLIPLLGDAQAIIVKETGSNLLQQKNKAMVRKALMNAAETSKNKQVREQATLLVHRLSQ